MEKFPISKIEAKDSGIFIYGHSKDDWIFLTYDEIRHIVKLSKEKGIEI